MSCNDRSKYRTFRAREDAAIRALLECLVELSGESSIRDAGEVVIGEDVFLECLTAVANQKASAKYPNKRWAVSRREIARRR